MPTYNLLECSDNYSMTSGRLCYYCYNNKTTASKYFEYKTKIIGSTPNTSNTLYTEVLVPLKYF